MARNFLKELEQLANPAPSREEDDHEDEVTTARVVDKSQLIDDDSVGNDHLQSRLPRRGVILADEDERYKGTVVRRSMLDDDEEEEDSGEDIVDWGSVGEKESDVEEDDEGDGEEDQEDEESGEDDQEEEGSEDDEVEMSDDVVEQDNDSTGLMKMFSSVDMQDENAKGRAVQAQIKLWEQLLGTRIRFQRVLALVNQLPQTNDEWNNLQTIASDFGAEQQTEQQKSFDECRRVLKSALDELISVQDQLLKRNDILGSGASTAKNQTGDVDDDDEVLSSPDEDEEPKDKTRDKNQAKKRKLIDLEDYSVFLGDRNAAMKSFRDQTILKWFEKTRLATGRFSRSSFNAFENNALQQIEHIVSDRNRLIKRTQLKRSTYPIFGKKSRVEENGNEKEADQEYDEEIFDDDDFYQQLLRELIERRTVGITDPVALSRQWLQLQKLRSKSKKKNVDRKASKGRRCRYDVMPKLVNFMAPVDHCPMTDEARDELFRSLFKNTS